MKKYILISLILFSINLYSQQYNQQNNQPRKKVYKTKRIKIGCRLEANLNEDGIKYQLKNNFVQGNIGILLNGMIIKNFFYIQPEIQLPFNKDTVESRINFIMNIKGFEFLGGVQYNYRVLNIDYNKIGLTSHGLNIGLNKRIIKAITIGVNCYIPDRKVSNMNDYNFFKYVKINNLRLNIQFRI